MFTNYNFLIEFKWLSCSLNSNKLKQLFLVIDESTYIYINFII